MNKDVQRTRQWGNRWTWSTSLSMDTSGIHLQTDVHAEHQLREDGVPDQWKRIYRPMQNLVGGRN